MKFICSRDRLVEIVSIVQKAVSTRSTLPILDGILIDAGADGVRFTGYDLETGIEAQMDADVSSDGQVVVNSKLFGEIIRKLPDEQVQIETNDQLQISIESGSSLFSIKGLSSEAYPKIPVVMEDGSISISQKLLKDMIRQTIFAVSTDESRPTLNGCLLSCDGFAIEMVAIDGFRLALRKRLIGEDLPKMNYIIPGKALNEVGRVLSQKDEEVHIFSSSNHIMFDLENIRIVSRLIQGTFMNYRAILPQSSDTTLVVSSSAVLSAIERASLIILSEDRRCPVQFSMVSDDTLVISAQTDVGALREEVPVTITGDKIDIDFNPRYFIDALRAIDNDEISIIFNGNVGPCVVKPLEGEDFSYLVLPLRR